MGSKSSTLQSDCKGEELSAVEQERPLCTLTYASSLASFSSDQTLSSWHRTICTAGSMTQASSSSSSAEPSSHCSTVDSSFIASDCLSLRFPFDFILALASALILASFASSCSIQRSSAFLSGSVLTVSPASLVATDTD